MNPSLSLSACSNISLSSFLEYLSPTYSEILSKSSNLISPSLSVSNYLKRSAKLVSSLISEVKLEIYLIKITRKFKGILRSRFQHFYRYLSHSLGPWFFMLLTPYLKLLWRFSTLMGRCFLIYRNRKYQIFLLFWPPLLL